MKGMRDIATALPSSIQCCTQSMVQLPENTFIHSHLFLVARPFIRLNLLSVEPQFFALSVCYPSRSLQILKHKFQLAIHLLLESLHIQAPPSIIQMYKSNRLNCPWHNAHIFHFWNAERQSTQQCPFKEQLLTIRKVILKRCSQLISRMYVQRLTELKDIIQQAKQRNG